MCRAVAVLIVRVVRHGLIFPRRNLYARLNLHASRLHICGIRCQWTQSNLPRKLCRLPLEGDEETSIEDRCPPFTSSPTVLTSSCHSGGGRWAGFGSSPDRKANGALQHLVLQAQSDGWLHVLLAVEILVEGDLSAREYPEGADGVEVHAGCR